MKTKALARTPLTRLERETIIVFNEAEKLATVTTNSPSVARKLGKRLGETKENTKGPDTWEWEVPKAWVTLPRARTKGKSLTNSAQKGNPGALASWRAAKRAERASQ